MATRKSSNGGCAIDQLEPSSATRKHGNKPDACAAPTSGMPHPSMVALERERERERAECRRHTKYIPQAKAQGRKLISKTTSCNAVSTCACAEASNSKFRTTPRLTSQRLEDDLEARALNVGDGGRSGAQARPLRCLNYHNKRDAANLTWIYQTAYRYSNYHNTRNAAKLYHKLL